MKYKDGAKFWDVRFTTSQPYKVKQADGTFKEYERRANKLACVAALTARDAIDATVAEWADAEIWQVNNHGAECHIIVDDKVR